MKKKMLTFLAVCMFIATLSAQDAGKDEVIQSLPHGKINWTKKFVYATGSGAPNLKSQNVAQARLGSERAAKLDAMRNLLETIQGVQVTGNTTMKNAMETSMEIKTNIDGVVKGMEIVDTKYYSDGGVDVVVRVPLSSFSEELRNQKFVEEGISGKETIAIKPEQGVQPSPEKGDTKGDKKNVLVLDVRGSKFTPALFPVIYSEDGKVLYSKKQVKDDVLKAKGMVNYVKDDLESIKDMYGDKNDMLVLKVNNIKNKSDLVISTNDITSLSNKLSASALNEGKVVILF